MRRTCLTFTCHPQAPKTDWIVLTAHRPPISFPLARGQCVVCGANCALTAKTETCTCGSNLAVRYGTDADAFHRAREARAPGLWRYGALLPVSAEHASKLQVGWTPLLHLETDAGVALYLKDETRNPSGSLKDRASEVAVAVAAAHGIDTLVMASTGNAAASLSAIGAAAGRRVIVAVPANVPPAKLAQIRAYGATVHKIAGTYAEACAVAARIAHATGAMNRTTGLNPFTREGKKTCAFEIAEQMDWDAPDWVIVPTGDGNILSAMAKGFAELHALGVITRQPRLVAVQTSAATTIVLAFDPALPGAASHGTIADSIDVAEPQDFHAAVAALRATDGRAVIVPDDEIRASVLAMASRHGVFLEPSSAAAHAAFVRLQRDGAFAKGARVVLLGTGTGLKDPRPVLEAFEGEALTATRPEDWRQLLEPVTAPVGEPA